MLKNKKGFTLIEILAAVTILGILSSIAIVAVNRIIQNAKEQHYVAAEENLVLAGQTYVQQNRSALPKAIGQKTTVTLQMLIDNNYIKPIKEYNGNKNCDASASYVQIFKYSQTDYSYSAYLKCDGNRADDGEPEFESEIPVPYIIATIQAEEKSGKGAVEANITIAGDENDNTVKLLSYSYIIYRDGIEVYNTGNIQVNGKKDNNIYEKKDNKKSVEINIPLEKYTPGAVKMVVSAVNIEGNTKTQQAEIVAPDKSPPTCEYINPEDDPTKVKDRKWLTSREITVKCNDGDGLGCVKDMYTQQFNKKTDRIGTIQIADKAGNTFDCEVNAYVDIDDPECVYPEGSKDWKKGSIDLKYGCKDEDSGCSPSANGGSLKFSGTAQTYNLPAYTIKDAAGNQKTCSAKAINVYIDNTPPTNLNGELRTGSSMGTIRTNSTNWTKDTIWLGNFSATDSHSQVDYYEYSTNCTNNKNGEFTPGSSFTFDQNENNAYCIRAVDKAGNVSGWTTTPFYINIDKTPPTCGTSSVNNSTKKMTVNCSDNIDCLQTTFTETFSNITDTVTIKDTAGNTKECPGVKITINHHNTWKKNNDIANIKSEVSISGGTLTIKTTVSRTHNGLLDITINSGFNIILTKPDGKTETISGSCKQYKEETVTMTHNITQVGTYTIKSESEGSTVKAFNVGDLAQITVG